MPEEDRAWPALSSEYGDGMDERATKGNLTERIDAWPSWAAVTILAAAGLTLVTADHAFPSVGMGPLYIPLIALAGWRLGLRASCAVAVLASFLNIFPMHVHELGLDPGVAVARGVIRFSAYAFTIAVIFALRRAYDRERIRATHDPLTGALNRTAFDREIEALLDSHKTGADAIALAMIEVDDFKRINDTHGHAAGDHVLRVLTASATRALGGMGQLYRLGGDEFAVVLPLPSISTARHAVERVHRTLSVDLGRSFPSATISMGALVFQPDLSLDRTVLLHEADRHIYLGKLAGKGCVRIATRRPVDALGVHLPADGSAFQPA